MDNEETEKIVDIIERLEGNNKEINIYVNKLLQQNRDLIEKNKKLQDEVDSLWAMMDEITKSDIENWSSILEDLEKDVLVRSLMVTKKKALA